MLWTRSDASGGNARRPAKTGAAAIAALFALVFMAGCLLAVVVPPLSGPDEIFHWQRAVQISRGQLLPVRVGQAGWGGKIDKAAHDYAGWAIKPLTEAIPFGISEATAVARQLKTRSEQEVLAAFPSTASYPPLAYLPQALGVGIAQAAGADPLGQIVAGRIANLAAYLGVIALALRALPAGRLTFLAIAFIPMAIHLAASLSADPLNFALPALLIAWCLRLRADQQVQLTRPVKWLLAALTCALGLLKPTYLILSVVVALIPAARFGSVGSKWIFVCACAGAAAAVGLAWNATHPFLPGLYWGTGANPQATVLSMARDPFTALETLFRSVRTLWGYWGVDGYGRFGGSTPPSPYVLYTSPAVSWLGLYLMLALAVSEPVQRRDLLAAAFTAALGVAFFAVVILAFWVAFTPPAASLIAGVQGRYFYLTWLLFALCLVLAAPLGGLATRLTVPLFVLVLGCHALTVWRVVDHFRFYWAN